MKLPDLFSIYRSSIDAELKTVLGIRELPLYDMMRYHLGWIDATGNSAEAPSGKALRPALCLLACDAVSGNHRMALPAAAAVELVHNFSLIHDDIQDNDTERRHRATVWSIWGKPQAINAGTAMRILANTALSRLGDDDHGRQKQLSVQRLLDEATLTLIEGQYLDISFESRLDVTSGEYLDMVEKKTAALISCSLEAGVVAGSGEQDIAAKFKEYGLHAGLAFQIRDDMLGIWGKSEETGKPTGSDILRKKKTYPLLYALNQTGNSGARVLREIYLKEEPADEDVNRALDVLDSVGAYGAAQRSIERNSARAIGIVDSLGIPDHFRSTLRDLTLFFGNRDR